MVIKKMKKKHLEQLSRVLTDAFNNWRFENRGKPPRDRFRKIEAMTPYLELEPDGCFVAVKKGKIIGGIFSHVWGKTGWIGTFGVSPEYQKKGIGKELVEKAIEYLDNERNVTKLALETMPDCKRNIALYSKLGFRPAFQTISMQKEVSNLSDILKRNANLLKKSNLEISYFSTAENKQDILLRCNWLTNKIDIGLDYSIEIELTKKQNFGDTLFIKKDGFIIGFAILHTFSRYNNESNDTLTIKALVIDLDINDKEVFLLLLSICEEFAAKNEKLIMKLYVNSSYWKIYQFLLEQGFTIRGSLLRMIRFSEEIKSFDQYNDWIVNCSGFLM